MGSPILGVLQTAAKCPRVFGDICCQASYGYPVEFKVIEAATLNRVMGRVDYDLLPELISAARYLEDRGAKMITTSCGFFVVFQSQISQAVNIPVFTSSLLQLPVVYNIVQKRIGIITANGSALTPFHIKCARADKIPIAIGGLECKKSFSSAILQGNQNLEVNELSEEVCEVAEGLLAKYPDIGAFVFECHNLPPYSFAVLKRTNLPVFDIMNLVTYVYESKVKLPAQRAGHPSPHSRKEEI